MEIQNYIKNSELIINYFGYWPTFHDAEIIEILLNSKENAANIKIYTYEISNTIDKNGNYNLNKKCHISFLFKGLITSNFTDFGTQNIISEIEFHKTKEEFKVLLNPSNGLIADIKCKEIAVENLEIIEG